MHLLKGCHGVTAASRRQDEIEHALTRHGVYANMRCGVAYRRKVTKCSVLHRVCGAHDPLIELGYIHVQAVESDILLGKSSNQIMKL